MVERLSSSQLTGAVVGNYRLGELIEQHKWGPIFAVQNKAGKDYILRFIGQPLPEDQDEMTPDARLVFLGRFQQEANLLSTLQHPHIMPLIDYGNYQGVPYLVYPNVQLTSLRALLTQSVPTDLYSVGRYLDQIASALAYAHERTMLHRNLSTRTIYMQPNRQLVIAEFGLLRIVELGKQAAYPKESDIPQRISYDGSNESGAPEQWLGKPIDAYADIYAMGTVLYRLLTGHQPFSGKTREEIARQHLYARVPPINTWRQGLPADLDHIIVKAMAKEPSQRYLQPGALAQAYREIIAPDENAQGAFADLSAFAAPSTPDPMRQASLSALTSSSAQSGKKPVSRRGFVIAAGAAGGAIVVAGAALLGANLLHKGLPLPGTGTPHPTVPPATKTGPSGQGTGQTTGQTSGNPSAPTKIASQGGTGTQGTLLTTTAKVPVNSAITFPLANQNNPGVLIHLPDNRFVAFDSTCTHQACEVKYNQASHLLECPCHGASFDPAKNAAVVQPPATTPLAAIKIMVNPDGTITKV